MTTIAIIRPNGLLAGELRQALGQKKDLWDEIHLLTDIAEEVGSLTEIGGAAAIVREATAESLAEVDAVVLGGDLSTLDSVLDLIPAETQRIALGTAGRPPGATPIVAGINLDAAAQNALLFSPDPAVVGLAHLLAPMRELSIVWAAATVLQPASTHDKVGLDEVFEQTKSILVFTENQPREIFGAQMAFNAIPSPLNSTAALAADLRTVLSRNTPISISLVQVGVFHSLGISLHVGFGRDPGLDSVVAALTSNPLVRQADDPAVLGPVDAAGSGEILLGGVEAQAGSYAIWCVMDNLTIGGALNAVAILEELGSRRTN